ncbi:response regulator [Mucilaginibacter sp.]|uniref:response regulator n=1 Tax=Mucilaginibacter sp. TaxID=1882438 RepID=UPI0035BBE818
MIKVLLADGHIVVRNGIRALLERDKEIQVLAEVDNGREALLYLKGSDNERPDIVITAINMPHMGGIELLKELKHINPPVKVIILSSRNNEKDIIEAFKTGASGYMIKSVSAVELLYGIKYVHEGKERFLCNELALMLLDKLVSGVDSQFNVDASNLNISNREVEILSLISKGFTNQEIADKLFTGKRTIESLRQALIEKTGTRNSAALIRYAVLNRIIG